MYAYTPQMNNETTTTVAPKERYHSDAIYVMYYSVHGVVLLRCTLSNLYLLTASATNMTFAVVQNQNLLEILVVETIPIPNKKQYGLLI